MKKKVFALILAATITAGSAVPVLATTSNTAQTVEEQTETVKEETTKTTTTTKTTGAKKTSKESPEKKVTNTPTPIKRKTPTPRKVTCPPSPKTGETDYVLFGALGAAAFASVAVLSKKKRDDSEA